MKNISASSVPAGNYLARINTDRPLPKSLSSESRKAGDASPAAEKGQKADRAKLLLLTAAAVLVPAVLGQLLYLAL